MKVFLLLVVVALGGCAHIQQSPAAYLEFAHPVSGALDGGGIWAIDDRLFSAPVASVTLRPGKRIVGYSCPGNLFVDWPPEVLYSFEPGRSYTIRCEGGKPVVGRK